MDLTFDTGTGSLAIDAAAVHPWGADLRALLERHGRVVSLKGVEMGLTILADGAEVFSLALPPPGVRYRQTDQDVLATGRASWQPDQAIHVTAWCRTASGHTVTAEARLTAPRPPQPYPSWTWAGGDWQPPVAYPDGDGLCAWDEAAQTWTPIAETDP
jgi:hypothetical protein